MREYGKDERVQKEKWVFFNIKFSFTLLFNYLRSEGDEFSEFKKI